MMDDIQMRMVLADLKARQQAGEHMPCPRCGEDTLAGRPRRNALSRQADVYVCSRCGVDEALRAMRGDLKPLSEWAIFISKPTAIGGGEARQ